MLLLTPLLAAVTRAFWSPCGVATWKSAAPWLIGASNRPAPARRTTKVGIFSSRIFDWFDFGNRTVHCKRGVTYSRPDTGTGMPSLERFRARPMSACSEPCPVGQNYQFCGRTAAKAANQFVVLVTYVFFGTFGFKQTQPPHCKHEVVRGNARDEQEPDANERRSPALVVAALAPVLRGQPGRNPGDNDVTTRHLSGRSVRVLAFGLASLP